MMTVKILIEALIWIANQQEREPHESSPRFDVWRCSERARAALALAQEIADRAQDGGMHAEKITPETIRFTYTREGYDPIVNDMRIDQVQDLIGDLVDLTSEEVA